MWNWAELPHDLICLIAKRINSFEDYFAFRGVCPSWRSAATKENFNPSSSPLIPLLMTPVPGSDSQQQEFYSLTATKKFAASSRVDVPAASKVCLESRGWLITIGEESHEMSLIHPFSGARFQLPNYPSRLNMDGFFVDPMPKVKIMYSDNNKYQGVFEIMILDGSTHQLMFWRNGDTAWTKLRFDFSCCSKRFVLTNECEPYVYFNDFSYHHMNQKFYAVTRCGFVVAFERDLQKNVVCPWLVGDLNKYSWHATYRSFYIVELSAASLIVVGRCDFLYGVTCEQFHVLEIDLSEPSTESVKRIRNLGDKAIFLCNSSVSTLVNVSSIPGKIEANNVYFIRDRSEESDEVCVYNIEDHYIKPYHCCGPYPPIFVTPNFY